MTDDVMVDELPAPGVTTSGGGYRATAAGGGVTWLCPHVHFTSQSARSCAEGHVKTMAKTLTRNGPAGG